MKKALLLALSIIFFVANINAQQIQVLTSGTKTSLRGLSVVDDNIVWASGSNGTVAKSIDGGKNWQWLKIAGYEKRDFRDIEAFDSNKAVIIAVSEPAVILRTEDGGNHWYKVFEDTTKGMFLDAMEFTEDSVNGKKVLTGQVIGDPINGRMFSAVTYGDGETWFPINSLSILKEGEAFFASSGTNFKTYKIDSINWQMCYVTGGTQSRFFGGGYKDRLLPLQQGKESTGANSLDINGKNIIVVGGDFMNDKDTTGNCALSTDLGATWYKPQTPPHGYRSCVIYINDKQLITCGTSGIDVSNDSGMNWQLISNESFHVVQKAKKGNAVFLAGGGGRIAKYNF